MSITSDAKRRQRSLLDVGDDVMEMILLRLPAFDLVRCKQVCTTWRSLISSPGFVSAHLKRSESDPQLLVHNRLFSHTADPLPGPFQSFICFSANEMFVVGSVNGLICIAGNSLYSSSPTPGDIWILNPVTGLSRKLPYSSNAPPLIVETRKVIFAFWCDAGVYKVAKLVSYRNGATMLELWVSTSPDAWTLISTFQFRFDFGHDRVHACDVLIEGLAAYWIVVDSDKNISVLLLDLKTLSLKFNPLSKQQSTVRVDLLHHEANSFLFGGNLNGEFVLIVYDFYSDGGVCYDVWAMVLDDGWVKKFTICLDSFPFEKCLGVVNEKLVLTSCDYRVVATYELVTGMLQVLETDSKRETISAVSTRGFVGSMVSINGFGFESNDVLRKLIGISWPYSYPSGRGGRRYVKIYKEEM